MMSSTVASAGVLTFEQAFEVVSAYGAKVSAPAIENAALLESLGRVLGAPVLADRDFPPFPRSTRDGYAVRSADIKVLPAKLKIIGQIKAGGDFNRTVASGEAVEIMTGAAVPEGADAVVMVEHTVRTLAEGPGDSDFVQVERAVAAGENVVPAAAEAHAGDLLLPAGMLITSAQIAMAAAVGAVSLSVFRQPKVAILATGDELVDVSERPGAHQIRNSNTYSLAAQVTTNGGIAWTLPVAPDEERKLSTLIQAGIHGADLLLLSGGVSMGKFDLVEKVLSEMRAEFHFTGALIQPGKPVVFGEVSNGPRTVPFFGLPGNPVSVMVTFDLFVRPVLQALSGCSATRLPFLQARLKKALKTKTGLTRFLPARIHGGLYDPEVEVIPWQGSGDLLASAKANCYLVVPPDQEMIAEGETVSVLVR
jgi:molybdopterin molybdotransferase